MGMSVIVFVTIINISLYVTWDECHSVCDSYTPTIKGEGVPHTLTAALLLPMNTLLHCPLQGSMSKHFAAA